MPIKSLLALIFAISLHAQSTAGGIVDGPLAKAISNPAASCTGTGFTLVQSQSSNTNVRTSYAFTTPNILGDTIIVMLRNFNADPGTVSDSQGNTYVQVGTTQNVSGINDDASVWMALNVKAGANTVSITNQAFLWIMVEYSGVLSSGALDTVAQGATATTSLTLSITTSSSNELAIIYESDGDLAPPSQSGTFTTDQFNSGTYGGTGRSASDFYCQAGSAGVYANRLTATPSGGIAMFLFALK